MVLPVVSDGAWKRWTQTTHGRCRSLWALTPVGANEDRCLSLTRVYPWCQVGGSQGSPFVMGWRWRHGWTVCIVWNGHKIKSFKGNRPRKAWTYSPLFCALCKSTERWLASINICDAQCVRLDFLIWWLLLAFVVHITQINGELNNHQVQSWIKQSPSW